MKFLDKLSKYGKVHIGSLHNVWYASYTVNLSTGNSLRIDVDGIDTHDRVISELIKKIRTTDITFDGIPVGEING